MRGVLATSVGTRPEVRGEHRAFRAGNPRGPGAAPVARPGGRGGDPPGLASRPGGNPRGRGAFRIGSGNQAGSSRNPPLPGTGSKRAHLGFSYSPRVNLLRWRG